MGGGGQQVKGRKTILSKQKRSLQKLVIGSLSAFKLKIYRYRLKKLQITNSYRSRSINNVEICNELNSYLPEIGPRRASKICEPCTESEVFQEIMHLNEKKSAGIENIPIKFIKMSAEYISPVLTSIYNKCMQIGVFPSKFKIAKVTQIYKNGCTYTASNYRPISVLSPFSKTFEKLIYHRRNHYLSNRNILTSEQFGFRAKHSTSHVITDVTNKLQNFCNNRNFTCLILLDLSKTFDTVNHQSLLKRTGKIWSERKFSKTI